jgi:hypothetical protein
LYILDTFEGFNFTQKNEGEVLITALLVAALVVTKMLVIISLPEEAGNTGMLVLMLG